VRRFSPRPSASPTANVELTSGATSRSKAFRIAPIDVDRDSGALLERAVEPTRRDTHSNLSKTSH